MIPQPHNADSDRVEHPWYIGSSMELKPRPVTSSEVCSLCGLDWRRHGKKPTGRTCIDLLRADLDSARLALANRPYVQPLPLVPHIPRPPYRTFG